jgi:hypothetical protein
MEPSLVVRSRGWHWTVAWSALLIVGIAIAVFGLVAVAVPVSDNEPLTRADGLASIGVGLFGVLITLFGFRSRQRWAWYALWFYPVFWLAHLVGQLPPGRGSTWATDPGVVLCVIRPSETASLPPLASDGTDPSTVGSAICVLPTRSWAGVRTVRDVTNCRQ